MLGSLLNCRKSTVTVPTALLVFGRGYDDVDRRQPGRWLFFSSKEKKTGPGTRQLMNQTSLADLIRCRSNHGVSLSTRNDPSAN